jgi:hypothetical protein
MTKGKRTKKKHTHKTKDRVTRTPLKCGFGNYSMKAYVIPSSRILNII